MSHELTLSHSFFHYAGEEQIVIKQLKLVDSDKLSVYFIYFSLRVSFIQKIQNASLIILLTSIDYKSAYKEDEIFEIMVKKLIDNIFN